MRGFGFGWSLLLATLLVAGCPAGRSDLPAPPPPAAEPGPEVAGQPETAPAPLEPRAESAAPGPAPIEVLQPAPVPDAPPVEPLTPEPTAAELAEQRRAVRGGLLALLERNPPTAQRDDVLLRLAALDQDEAVALRGRRLGLPPAASSDTEKLRQEERAHLEEAGRLLRRVIEEHAGSPHHDQALYELAVVLQQLDRPKQALTVFKTLIAKHPASRYLPDAYLAFGEWYFGAADLAHARMAYEKVLQFPGSTAYPYALYKLGWCEVNQSRFEQAMQRFADVSRLEISKALRREALNDYVLAYAQAGVPERAAQEFAALAPDGVGRMLERLASLYQDQGRTHLAAPIYRALLDPAVCTPEQLMYALRLLDGAAALGDRPRVLAEAAALVATYRRLTACLDPTAGGESLEALRAEGVEQLQRLATRWRTEAEQLASPEARRQADDLARQLEALVAPPPSRGNPGEGDPSS